jgi:hypothetical protein
MIIIKAIKKIKKNCAMLHKQCCLSWGVASVHLPVSLCLYTHVCARARMLPFPQRLSVCMYVYPERKRQRQRECLGRTERERERERSIGRTQSVGTNPVWVYIQCLCLTPSSLCSPPTRVRNRLSVSVCHAVWRMREDSGRTYIGTSGGMEALIEGGVHVRDQDSLPRTPEPRRG